MLDINLEIGSIDYKRCVEAMLPPLVRHCAEKTAPNTLDFFLAGLGEYAAPAACEMLDGMDADSKDRTVVWLVSAHEERMRNSANSRLAELFGASIVRIGHFAAVDRPGSRLALLAEQVDIDYAALLRSAVVSEGIERIGSEYGILKSAAKLAVQMGTHLSGESLEKQGLMLLNSARVRQRLMDALQDAVRQAGLDVELESVTAERAAAILLPQSGAQPLPSAFEEQMMQRLADKAAALRNGR